MKKQLVIVGIVVLLLVVGLSGCNEIGNHLSSEEDRFIGTWKQDKDFIPIGFTLFSDGTGSWQGVSATWELKEGKFTIYFSGAYIIYNYDFLTSLFYLTRSTWRI